MLVDLLISKRDFFTNNSITWLVSRYRVYESKKPFQRALIWRIHALIVSEIILVLIAFFFAVAGISTTPFAIPFVAAGFYLIWLYLRHYRKTVNELGMLVDRIEAMKNGKYEAVSSLPPGSDFHKAWEDLTHIQEGIQKAVEEKLRCERMKMELITNVSHDLKTPLTSIISYNDLIAKEEGLPDNVRNTSRSFRKGRQAQNSYPGPFELSKAASGDMVLDLERIDLVRLLEQTLTWRSR